LKHEHCVRFETFGLITVVFLTVGAFVAQLTIQRLAGFKPRYFDTLIAGLMGNGAAYLLGLLFNQVFSHLRLNVTLPLLCLMIATQVVVQATAYMLIARKREGQQIRFWHGCVATISVFGVGAAVLLSWSWLRRI